MSLYVIKQMSLQHSTFQWSEWHFNASASRNSCTSA